MQSRMTARATRGSQFNNRWSVKRWPVQRLFITGQREYLAENNDGWSVQRWPIQQVFMTRTHYAET